MIEYLCGIRATRDGHGSQYTVEFLYRITSLEVQILQREPFVEINVFNGGPAFTFSIKAFSRRFYSSIIVNIPSRSTICNLI